MRVWGDSWLVVEPYIANEWARAAGLFLIVMATIWAVANVYAGDLQKSEKGPVALRPHAVTRANFQGLIVQKHEDMLDMQSDGLKATVTFYYVFDDERGKRRRVKLASRKNFTLSVQPNAVPAVQNRIHGCEPVDDVYTVDVYIPPIEFDAPNPEIIQATPELLSDYYSQNRILDHWTGDDGLKRVAIPEGLMDDIREQRAEYIRKAAARLRNARGGGWLSKRLAKSLAKRRPSPLGNYYFKFEFKANPWFVLFKHPDRDLKMTAWLTVLTSMFALIMEAWPTHKDVSREQTVSAAEQSQEAPRPRTPPTRR